MPDIPRLQPSLPVPPPLGPALVPAVIPLPITKFPPTKAPIPRPVHPTPADTALMMHVKDHNDPHRTAEFLKSTFDKKADLVNGKVPSSQLPAVDVPAPSNAPPVMDGEASPGSSEAFARGDHRHPLAIRKTSDLENDGEDGTWPFQTVKAARFKAWYPDGSVTDESQFTQTLKYAFDTANHTATVLPFVTNGTPGEGNNADAAGDIVIPPYKDHDGVRYVITAIGVGSSGASAGITSLKAPTTVTNVGANAFYSCTSLTSVSLPACTSVGATAFSTCTSLASVSLPACTDVRASAFSTCTSLTSVSLPACTSVKNYAFKGCTSLASVSLPACTNVGANAFYSCTSLASVSLPACTSVGASAFYSCTSLTSVSLPACTSVGASMFRGCASLASVSIPACTSVGSYAFRDCALLASANFGPGARDSVPTLGSGAFYDDPNTCNIIVPDANYAAWTAPKLPDGVTDNPWYALKQAGYRFVRYSQWETPHRYEIPVEAGDIGAASAADATLAVLFSAWIIEFTSPPTGYTEPIYDGAGHWHLATSNYDYTADGSSDATSLDFSDDGGSQETAHATRSLRGYVLGSQTGKPLQPADVPGPTGPTGPTGGDGPVGPTGPTGSFDPTDLRYEFTSPTASAGVYLCADRGMNRVSLAATDAGLTVAPPPVVPGYARDFFVVLTVAPRSSAPGINFDGFVGSNGAGAPPEILYDGSVTKKTLVMFTEVDPGGAGDGSDLFLVKYEALVEIGP